MGGGAWPHTETHSSVGLWQADRQVLGSRGMLCSVLLKQDMGRRIIFKRYRFKGMIHKMFKKNAS